MIKFLFSGDLCISSPTPPKISDTFLSTLEDATYICVNFEGPVVERKELPTPKVGPSIKQHENCRNFLNEIGATHLNLANNHIMDYGLPGLRATLMYLDGFDTIGASLNYAKTFQPCIIEKDGQKIALLAFAEAQFGVTRESSDAGGFAWIDAPQARRAVSFARDNADWVIVQIHAGLEMVDIPLPEWRDRYRELIDLGADLVIGHHPHVLQGSESYKGKMIHYSLGNFYMDVMLRQHNPGSGALLEVIIDNGDIHSEIIPLRVTENFIDLDQTKETWVYYQSLCDLLANHNAYIEKIDEVCVKMWTSVYSLYYESALTGLGIKPNAKSLIKVIRRVLAATIRRQWRQQPGHLLLLHNIRIESHRWVVERALTKLALKSPSP